VSGIPSPYLRTVRRPVRLLFLNRSYYPDVEATGQLLAELCADLARRHEVIVIAGRPNFVADTGTASTCYTNCATVWPPLLTTGSPQAGTGADASLLGTTTRTDAKVEVTYKGHPLYYFFKDKAPGDTTGQGVNGFGGLWWVVSPSGAAITTK